MKITKFFCIYRLFKSLNSTLHTVHILICEIGFTKFYFFSYFNQPYKRMNEVNKEKVGRVMARNASRYNDIYSTMKMKK